MDKKKSQGKDFFEFVWNLGKLHDVCLLTSTSVSQINVPKRH